ncbi:MAG: hypothetical protein PVI90_12375 [Desulfobacteraceae bacterium]|jgi:hypothetical protein
MRKDFFSKKIWSWLFFLFFLSVSVLILVGCGAFEDDDEDDDSNASDNSELTISQLVGTYTLTGFAMDYNDGTHMDQDQLSSWSGDMNIDTDGIVNCTLMLEENTSEFHWEILEVDSENNSLHLKDSDSGCENWVDITLDGDNLTIMQPAGECFQDGALTFHFSRTSTSVQSVQNS